MTPVWWTCGCGERNCSPRVVGTPVCDVCGKPARFAIEASQNQGALFGDWLRGEDGREEGSKKDVDGD